MASRLILVSSPAAYILGIDYGDRRLGLALASNVARLPNPYKILANDSRLFEELNQIIKEHNVLTLIVGLPRNQSGQETAQSRQARAFARELQQHTGIEPLLIDESLSSRRAEQMARELKDRSAKDPIDDLAACFILEEFFNEKL